MFSTIIRTVIGIALFVATLVPAAAQGQDTKVTLLGTGCPPPVMHRFGPSTLGEAGGQMVGFPDLWLTGWLVGPGRNVPLQVWGPRGTRKMMSHLEQAYEFDSRIRLYDDRAAPAAPDGIVLLAEDIRKGVVCDKGGVKITAFEVDHTPVKPAFGYRIDYAGRSVVLSGDTRVSENLIQYAQGVDVLVHEVAAPETFQRAGVPPERAKSVVAHHVTPEQAGEVFSRAKPKLAVYSHIVLPIATEQELIPQTRKTYAGPLGLGEALMVIEVGEKSEVRRPARSWP